MSICSSLKEGHLNSKNTCCEKSSHSAPKPLCPAWGPVGSGKTWRWPCPSVCGRSRWARRSWKTHGSCSRQRISRRARTTLRRGNTLQQRGLSLHTWDSWATWVMCLQQAPQFHRRLGGITAVLGESRAKTTPLKRSLSTQIGLRPQRFHECHLV